MSLVNAEDIPEEGNCSESKLENTDNAIADANEGENYEPNDVLTDMSHSKSELDDVVADNAATKVLEKDDATDTKDVLEALAEVVQELKTDVKMNLGLGRLEE